MRWICKWFTPQTLSELMEEHAEVVCLEADLAAGVEHNPHRSEKFANRFIDAGVSEANMIGLAAGLAPGGQNSPLP